MNAKTQMNYANAAQKKAGISISASEYLRLEGLTGAALTMAAHRGHPLAPDATPEVGVVAAMTVAPGEDIANEFHSLVADMLSAPGYMARTEPWATNEEFLPVKALLEFFRREGCDPVRSLSRLTAQLGLEV